ncbi:exonuclease [Streptomyces bingchenggensis BCW-1]|uniref:Exonuclease n=1 Tax=Streptomyces bingchenggensis (strain BCW-1) TaxID=749414 RepID=D7C4H3_STRBB|nr:exonuclease [Streptomyces bingchenggensis BCW-1]
MRIATWNVNSITARLPRLLAWLESSGTDVLCIQEIKSAESAFPYEPLRELGYEAAVNATGRWNGVGVISRVGLADVTPGLPGGPDYEGEQEPRAIAATCGGVRVQSVYVPNGREIGHPHYDYKLRWFEALRTSAAVDAAGGRAPRRGRRGGRRPLRRPRRLQCGAGRRGRMGPRRLRGLDACHHQGARGAGRPARGGPVRCDAAPPEVRPPLHLLGLPGAGLPEEQGHADRPGVWQRGLHQGRERCVCGPRGAQGQGRLGPRAGRRRPRHLTPPTGAWPGPRVSRSAAADRSSRPSPAAPCRRGADGRRCRRRAGSAAAAADPAPPRRSPAPRRTPRRCP